MSARIALATSRELPDLDADDHGLVTALRARGVSVTLPVWDDPGARWDVDIVVVRSTWDYSERRDAFVAWAERVEATAALWNPPAMVRWNTDKRRYLGDLAAAGVPTVPTLWLDRDATRADLRALVETAPWAERAAAAGGVVLKPIVGAGARDTIRVPVADLGTVGQRFLDEQRPRQALMIQPFLPRIQDGEVSLIFFDGAYSHAVVKRPKSGDFRSQPEFGSSVVAYTPTAEERAVADHALHVCGGFPLYARVDLVTGLDGCPVLLELEVTEPCLYLCWHPGSADVFADAILRRADAARRGAAHGPARRP